jgi:hypothetical protein
MNAIALLTLAVLSAPSLAADDTCSKYPDCSDNYAAYQSLYSVSYKNERREYSRFLERYNSFSKDRDYTFTGKEVWEAEPLSRDAWGKKWEYRVKYNPKPWSLEINSRGQDLDGYIAGYDAAKKLDQELLAAKRGGPKTFQSMLDKRIEHAFPGDMGKEKFKARDVIYAYLGEEARALLDAKKEYLSALKKGTAPTAEQVKKFGPPEAYTVRGNFSQDKKQFGREAKGSVTAMAARMADKLKDDRAAQVPDDEQFFLRGRSASKNPATTGGGGAAPTLTPMEAAALCKAPMSGAAVAFRKSLTGTRFADIAAVEGPCYKHPTQDLIAELDNEPNDTDRYGLLVGELTGRWQEASKENRLLMLKLSPKLAEMTKATNGGRGLSVDEVTVDSGSRTWTDAVMIDDGAGTGR